MAVYCFYTNTVAGLAPSLYAYTDKKDIAKEFGCTRKGLRKFVKLMEHDQFRSMKNELRNLEIIPEELITRNEAGEMITVRIYATGAEIIDFRGHIDGIATVLLGLSTVDPNVFTKEMKELLDAFGYTDTFKATHDPGFVDNPFLPGFGFEDLYSPKLWNGGKYVIDEYELFVIHRWSTFFDPTTV